MKNKLIISCFCASRAAFHTDKPQTIQAVTDSRYLSRVLQERHLSMLKIPGIVKELDHKFQEIFARSYPLAEGTNLETADTVIVAAGSLAQTVKSFLNTVEDRKEKLGLLRLRLFRPLPKDEIASLLSGTISKIVVIDRNVSAGVGGIFAQELRALLQGIPYRGKIFEFNLAGGIDLTPAMMEKVLQAISEDPGSEGKIIWGVDLQ